MALITTPDIEFYKPRPAFRLKSVFGDLYDSQEKLLSKPSLIMFICNHCPYVQAIEDRLILLTKDLQHLGFEVIGICSNDSLHYPDDAPEKLKKRAQDKNFPFVYLHDADQSVAKSFGAVCTPDFFMYDSQQRLVYRGRLDDSWKDPALVTKRELYEAAVTLVKNPTQVSKLKQTPSMGCSIKWSK